MDHERSTQVHISHPANTNTRVSSSFSMKADGAGNAAGCRQSHRCPFHRMYTVHNITAFTPRSCANSCQWNSYPTDPAHPEDSETVEIGGWDRAYLEVCVSLPYPRRHQSRSRSPAARVTRWALGSRCTYGTSSGIPPSGRVFLEPEPV
jgi:hypothetical protein